jgi:hypothetical protein
MSKFGFKDKFIDKLIVIVIVIVVVVVNPPSSSCHHINELTTATPSIDYRYSN